MTGTDADENNSTPREVIAKDADADLEADNSTGKDEYDGALALRRFLDNMENSEEGASDANTLREWICPLVKEGVGEDLNMRDGDGQTLLHIAARQGLATAAKSLIVDAKANVNTQNNEGSTPLIETCWGDNMALVEILLENGADVEIFDNDGWSSLFLAARHGNNSMFQRLWKAHKWDVDLTENFTGISLLQGAAYGGNRQIVQCLRSAGARLDSRDYDGWTPLFAAIAKKRKDTIDELLKGGNNEDLQLETEDFEGRTPLLKAAEDEFWDGVHILVDAGAKCNKSEASKTTQMDQTSATPLKENTALHCAVWQNNLQMVKFLLEHEADINARDPDGQQPMHLASLQGNEAILGFLLDYDNCSHVDTGDDDGMTPLHLASCPHQVEYTASLRDSDSTCQADEEINSAKSDPGSKAGHYNEVVRHLLARMADTTLLTKDGKTAVELAFDHDHHARGEAVLKVFSEKNGGLLNTLMWAAGKAERRAIATSLVKRHLKESGSSLVGGSEDWNAIELAAHARETRILWLLIASSPQGKETKRILKSAKAIVEESKDQGEKSAINPDDQETDLADDTKKRNKGTTRQAILDIINNPPTGLIYRDRSTYSVPKDDDKLLSSDSPYHATIVQFYKRQGKFDSIMRAPTIRETIYSQGPAGVMDKVVEQLKGFANSHLRDLRQSDMVQRPMFMDSNPKFTWIHLPATNMTWMEHLLQRIMRDENQHVTHFNQAKSFFKDSWIEVPDKTSLSRIMRPRFVSRDTRDDETQNGDAYKMSEKTSDDKGDCDAQNDPKKSEGMDRKESAKQVQNEDTDKLFDEGGDGGEHKDKESKDANVTHGSHERESTKQRRPKNRDEEETVAPSLAVTAIYMPYLSYSFQCNDELDDSCETETEAKSPQDEKKKEKPAKVEGLMPSKLPGAAQQQVNEQSKYVRKSDQEEEFKYARKLVEARKTYQKLLDEYDGKIVHGSSTLDESYYHFGEDQDSTKDKSRRNKSQVVTESWRKEKLGPYWLLIRVNQLWIWTINNKWLISASSHPMDDSEDELLNGILDRLEKQGEAGGSDLQPGSTAEMSQLIVDYCVDSYERKPKAHEDERPDDCKLKDFPSIRQAFSKSINSIARDETKLFAQFSDLTKELRETPFDNTIDHDKVVKTMNDELGKATIEAEKLSEKVKDILDELSILEATVQYQQDVQRAMRRQNVTKSMRSQDIQKAKKQDGLETAITTTYIINDIKGMESVANRIHTAVNTTLSLQQSEVANLQARFSIEQSKLSIKHAELATQQGRVLMVFTVVTILFLPMSFLTSLFALDVASFQQAPAWALVVIFLVSLALFIPAVCFAFAWEGSKRFLTDPVGTSIEGVMAFICYLLRHSETSNRTQDDKKGETKPDSERLESSLQQTTQRPAINTGSSPEPRKSSKALAERNRSDLEKGLAEPVAEPTCQASHQ